MERTESAEEIGVGKEEHLKILRAKGIRTNAKINKSMIEIQPPKIKVEAPSETYSTFYFKITDTLQTKHTTYEIEVQTAMGSWTIYKRYSELLRFHGSLKRKYGKEKDLIRRLKEGKDDRDRAED